MFERYAHVLGFALSHPWSVTPEMLQVIAGILARRIAGVDVERSELEAALVNRKNLPQPRAGSVAIIPVYGVIAPRMNLLTEISGGTTFEKLTAQVREVVADKAVSTVVLDVDSPGGSVAGSTEFAAELMRARTKKPIVAQGQFLIGSAAFQAAAACTEIVAAPSARVGSIGTYMIHNDLSAALKQLGVTRTFISAGEGKVDGNDAEPLSDAARGRMQAAINEAYGQFVNDVVRGRGAGMTPERVRDEWKAHVYSAAEALRIGMIDRVATLDQTVARILESSSDPADRRAAADVSVTLGTDQERPAAAATSQDRQSELELERQVLALQLP